MEEIIIELCNRYLDFYEYDAEEIGKLEPLNADNIAHLKQSMALLSAYQQNIMIHIPKIVATISSDLAEMKTASLFNVEFYFKEKAEDKVPSDQVVVEDMNRYSICVSAAKLDSTSIINTLRFNILLDFE